VAAPPRARRAEAARVLLVAPPGPSAPQRRRALAGFYPVPLDPPLAAGARLVCADDDPYCPEDAREVYARPLGIDADLIPGGGHLNPDSGYGPWPAAEDWAVPRPAVPRRGLGPLGRGR
jgi:predicted alpha/beta hydrolase family esterase